MWWYCRRNKPRLYKCYGEGGMEMPNLSAGGYQYVASDILRKCGLALNMIAGAFTVVLPPVKLCESNLSEWHRPNKKPPPPGDFSAVGVIV